MTDYAILAVLHLTYYLDLADHYCYRQDLTGLTTYYATLVAHLNHWQLEHLIPADQIEYQKFEHLFMNERGEDGGGIRVHAESNISPKGKIDLALSLTHRKEDGSLEEDCLIIELKYVNNSQDVDKKLKEAEEQSDKKYNLVRSCTSKRTAKSLVLVFNKGAKNANELIVANIKDFKVLHTTSQSETDSQTVVDSSDEKQELVECDFQECSSSFEDNLSLVTQVDLPYREQKLVECSFQEGSPPSKRRKRTRSTEPQRSVKPKSDLDSISVQGHSTQARRCGQKIGKKKVVV